MRRDRDYQLAGKVPEKYRHPGCYIKCFGVPTAYGAAYSKSGGWVYAFKKKADYDDWLHHPTMDRVPVAVEREQPCGIVAEHEMSTDLQVIAALARRATTLLRGPDGPPGVNIVVPNIDTPPAIDQQALIEMREWSERWRSFLGYSPRPGHGESDE